MAPQKSSESQTAATASAFKPYGNPDVTFSTPYLTLKHGESFTPAAKRIMVDSTPLKPSALQPESNNRYPLLTTDCAPFPYIDPTLVTWPELKEAQLSILRRLPGKMPVVTPRHLRVGLHKALKRQPGPHPPIYHAPTARIIAPPSQIATVAGNAASSTAVSNATSGNMGPPPHPSLKRRRDV